MIVALVLAAPVLAQQPTPLELQINQDFLFDVRSDIETLADQAFGVETRPDGWRANFDLASASMAPDLWYDNELLADMVFGAGVRPNEWLGATTTSLAALVRNARHDLELMATTVFESTARPDTWRGAAAIYSCSRTLQNLVSVLGNFYRILPQTPDSALNFCSALQAEIEDELINILFGTPGEDGTLTNVNDLLSGVRGDLERTVDELLGLNTRPPGYVGNRDATTPGFAGDLFLDLETMADLQFGQGVRPDGWIGVISTSPGANYFALRHDVELFTDATLGFGTRPVGWQGVNPLERCRPQVTQLVTLVKDNYDITFDELDPAAPDFCAQIESAANAVVENPPVIDVVVAEDRFNATSNYAFSYLDVSALQYMGIIPGGVPIRAVYRNFGASEMMFVAGEEFALYVDRRFTTLPETVFNSLPTLEGVDPITFCDARWCNGPGPTPTPTGSGPLEAVLFAATPVATPNPGMLEATKQLVSWNYVRVTYIQDNPATRSAQVTLELCQQPAQNAVGCEPVLTVFNTQTAAFVPPIAQFNGLNVFELPYGYSTNVVIESQNFFSNDVWISDPTIR
ncbi:MAG TPA: hypothetical protein VER79_08750 [Candidatus Limnocylindrales bacterium]|nr:hypothetical protein [Candidatus Limnocylindrales bacterium]